MLPHAQGGRRTYLGEPLLDRPRELSRVSQTLEEAKANAGRGVLYARGFYSYLSGGHAEWSGTDLALYADLADGFSGSAQFHHEYREERGDLGLASLAIRVAPEIFVTSTVAAGNGVDYLPITSLALEVSGPAPRTCRLRLGAVASTSWWAHAQRDLLLGGVARALLPGTFVAEGRVEATITNAPDDTAHLGVRGTLAVAHGRHGRRVWQARVAVGDEPAYAPGQPLSLRDDALVLDAAVGLRGWVRRPYGYLVQLAGGHEVGGHVRVGGDLSVFLEF
ncbi:MAG: YaiO family outer membrane beta-barrel protein [Kofleriaceae bacterium]